MRSSRPSWFAVIVLFALLVPLGPSAVAAAGELDDSTWVDEAVPGTRLAMRRPAGWVRADASLAAQMGSAAGHGPPLVAVGDPTGGDNVVVNEFVGVDAQWYGDLAEFKAMAHYSAETMSDGKLVATGKRTIGGMPAYWDLEAFDDAVNGTPVFYSELEVRTAKRKVVTFAINVNRSTPHARRVVAALIENVRSRPR